MIALTHPQSSAATPTARQSWQGIFTNPAPQLSATPLAQHWVCLCQPPHPLSDDEALLLCQEGPETWVVWIPGYGEAIVHRAEFCWPAA
ncbi:hypothetical protein [Trichothermofontia sp.]